MYTNADNMGKIGPVLAETEIFVAMCRFLSSSLSRCCKNFNFSPRNLRGYWTKVHLILTRIVAVNVCISCGTPEQRVNAVNLDVCNCHHN